MFSIFFSQNEALASEKYANRLPQVGNNLVSQLRLEELKARTKATASTTPETNDLIG